MTIKQYGHIPFPRYPINNVTPFTYRDGYTYLEQVERLRAKINELVDAGNLYDDNLEAFTNEVNALIADILSKLVGYTIEVSELTYTAEMMDGSEFSAYTITGVDQLLEGLENSLTQFVNGEVTSLTEFLNTEVSSLTAFVNTEVSSLTAFVNTSVAELLNTVNRKTDYIHNVMDYGAEGDGSTDDTAAVVSAIAACSPGETVFFPPNRTFRVADNIKIEASEITLSGSGEITLSSLGSMVNRELFTVTGHDVTFDGMRINGNNHLSKAIVSTGRRTKINNCVIENLYSNEESSKGIFIMSRYGATITGNIIRNIHSVGNGVPQDNDGAARAIEIRMDTPGAIEPTTIANNLLQNVHGEEGDTIQVAVTGGGNKFPSALVTIAHNKIIDFTRRGIKIQGSRCTINNNYVASNLPGDASGTYHAMDILFSDNTQIFENEIRGSSFNGVWLNGNPDNESYNNIVRNNLIVNGNKTAVYVYNNPRAEIRGNVIHDGAYGVRAVNSNYITVTQNQFLTTVNDSPRLNSAVYVHDTCWRPFISENVFRGPMDTGVHVVTTLAQESTVIDNYDFTTGSPAFLYTNANSSRSYVSGNRSDATRFHMDAVGTVGHIKFGENAGRTSSALVIFGDESPQTSSTLLHQRGTVCFNTSATSDTVVGWICTAGGTPGTWRSF